MSVPGRRVLWVVRHGETVWNAQGLLTGWADPPLSERGQAQAMALRAHLSEQQFDSVWTSDLTRARHTAELAWQHPASPDPRLREIDFGDLDGRNWMKLDSCWRELLLDQFDRFHAPGGEHSRDFQQRVLEFVEHLPPGRHLLFSHGGVLRLLMRELGQDQFLPNASLAVLHWDERLVADVRRLE